ncbi:hypothetical protein SAMN05216353_11210 [Halobacillus alkaliphilus]|uniref:Uncharacterized protein n=1 Tax=Halobacillus alkaliphilus TaxID=396056 RepID=A0A1I2M925_9BACI|nr:hypothetical protein [Halobacillus alkaliphilus]SFF88004.1 hypothetical protein SAMN05216353_11210 [Halobacillus alkaliphilus]
MSRKKYTYDKDMVLDLVSNSKKKYTEIAKETNCPYSTVIYYGRKIRGQPRRVDVPINSIELNPNPNRTPKETIKLNEDPDIFWIEEQDVFINEAEVQVSHMIRSAKILGIKKLHITVRK